MSKIKVVHYINQFFAQIGGEEKADYPAEIRVGEVVGPGLALTQNFKDEAEIIATVICGDSYFNENLEKAKADIEKEQKQAQQEVQGEIAKLALIAARKIIETGEAHDAEGSK